MSAVKEIVFMACTALIVGEVVYYLTPKDKVVDAVYGLVYTAVLVTAVMAFTRADLQVDFTAPPPAYQEEIDALLRESYVTQTQAELEKIVAGALDTVHIRYRDMDFIISMDEEGAIEIDRLLVKLEYRADEENARAILNQLFENTVQLEVQGES